MTGRQFLEEVIPGRAEEFRAFVLEHDLFAVLKMAEATEDGWWREFFAFVAMRQNFPQIDPAALVR